MRRDGRITFSDIPCSSDAKPMALNVYTPSPGGGAGGQPDREIEQSLANGQKQRQAEALRNLRSRQKSEDEQRDDPDHGEQGKIPANVSAEMQSVTTRYQKEIESLNLETLHLAGKINTPCFGTENIPEVAMSSRVHTCRTSRTSPPGRLFLTQRIR